MRVCRGSLADYELYVAGFYLRRNDLGRLEAGLRSGERFRGHTEQWRQAAVLLIETYLALTSVQQDGIEPVRDGKSRAKAPLHRGSSKPKVRRVEV